MHRGPWTNLTEGLCVELERGVPSQTPGALLRHASPEGRGMRVRCCLAVPWHLARRRRAER